MRCSHTTRLPSPYGDEGLTSRARASFLHGRITLLRPMLARHCLSRIPAAPNDTTAGRSGSLNPRIIQDCAALCVENAQKMIALIVDECSAAGYPDAPAVVGAAAAAAANADAGPSGTIPWWYRVFYLHLAGVVLMAATLQPSLCTPTASESWARVMAALRAHEHLSPFVSQCLATFETLSAGMCSQQEAPQYVAPVAEEGTPGNLDAASMPPLHDVLFQDIVFETEAMFFGMEDHSWVSSFALPP